MRHEQVVDAPVGLEPGERAGMRVAGRPGVANFAFVMQARRRLGSRRAAVCRSPLTLRAPRNQRISSAVWRCIEVAAPDLHGRRVTCNHRFGGDDLIFALLSIGEAVVEVAGEETDRPGLRVCAVAASTMRRSLGTAWGSST